MNALLLPALLQLLPVAAALCRRRGGASVRIDDYTAHIGAPTERGGYRAGLRNFLT